MQYNLNKEIDEQKSSVSRPKFARCSLGEKLGNSLEMSTGPVRFKVVPTILWHYNGFLQSSN
jgi:hypothetical protein